MSAELGMAFISADFGSAADSGISGSTNKPPDFTGETPFQKMMSKALAKKEAPSESDAGIGADKIQQETEDFQAENTADILSQVLFASGTQTKKKLPDLLQVIAGTENQGLSADTEAENHNAGPSMENTEAQNAVGMLINAIQTQANGEADVSASAGANDAGGAIEPMGLKNFGFAGARGFYQMSTAGNVLAKEQTSESTDGSAVMASSGGSFEKLTLQNMPETNTTQKQGAFLEGQETTEQLADTAKQKQSFSSMTVMSADKTEQVSISSLDNTDTGNKNAVSSGSRASAGHLDAGEKMTTEADNLKHIQKAETPKSGYEEEPEASDGKTGIEGYQGIFQRTESTEHLKSGLPNQVTDPGEAHNQIRDAVLAKLEQKGANEFRMQLQPESLGQIDINLKLSDGLLTINILADSSKTQALLTGQVDKLISGMGLHNVQVESVQVNQQMNPDSQGGQNQAYTGNSGMNFSQSGRDSSGEQGWRQLGAGSFGVQGEMSAEADRSVYPLGTSFYKMDYVV